MTAWRVLDEGTVQGYYAPRPVTDVPGVRTDGRVSVAPLSFDSWRNLRVAGQVVPHPLPFTYAFPPPLTPRNNQIVTAEFLATHNRAICLNGMRTGKTMATLWAADYLQHEGAVKKVLIVAPKSTLELVWERSILTTWGHRKKSVILKGSAERKRQDAARDVDFVIVNPESLHLIADVIDPGLVVVDEATSMKNPTSRRWKALNAIVGEDMPLWLLTATPTQQSPEDALGLIRLLHKEYISKNRWRGLTMDKVTQFKWIPKKDAEETVARWLQPAIRFTLDDCGDVPTVQKEYLDVEMTPEQARVYTHLENEAVAKFESGEEVNAVNAGALLSKLLQVQGGGVYVHDDEGERQVRQLDATPMHDAIREYVDQADTPVIVFAPFRSVAETVARELGVPLYYGDTKTDERRDLVDRFQAGELKALVAVPDTMSHGITLDRANYVLWVLPPFKSEVYAQANGRVLQAASNKRIMITHLSMGQLTKRRYVALETKEQLQTTVLDLLQRGE